MLIEESFQDVETRSGKMRVFIYHPSLPNYPQAKFPGVVVFSEIYQVTGPVQRFAQQIAAQGYISAAPSIYHEFMSSEPLPYDNRGTDRGNDLKGQKALVAYDEDAMLTIDMLENLSTCNGRIGATGMCLGGHLAFRCSFDTRIMAAFCLFATDIHSETLGQSRSKSLERCGEIKGELCMVFGTHDTHVPVSGRSLIRSRLQEKDVKLTFLEIYGAQHAFVRDALSKGRFDAAITKYCLEMMFELFHRRLCIDLGPESMVKQAVDHVC